MIWQALPVLEVNEKNRLFVASCIRGQIFRVGQSVSKRLGILKNNKTLPREMTFMTALNGCMVCIRSQARIPSQDYDIDRLRN